ncbi:MAG: hypothetical protein ACI4JJ_03700 [Huintestinicola sp.]
MIIWLVSPVALLVVCLCQRSQINKLKRENIMLRGMPQQRGDNAPPRTADTGDYSSLYSGVSKAAPEPSAAVPESTENIVQPTAEKEPVPEMISENAVSEAAIPSRPSEENKGINTINTVLILGALFISLAGFVFAAAAWGMMNAFFKSAALISFSAVFFLLFALSDKKLGLERTGRTFFILGSIFLPASVFVAGLLKVFGEFFSFDGEGSRLVAAVMFLMPTVPFFAGAVKYKSKAMARIAFCALSAFAAAFLGFVFRNSGSGFSLAASVFALAAVLASPYLKKIVKNTVISSEISWFSLVNTVVLGVTALFLSDTGFMALASMVIFGVCFLSKTFLDKSSAAGVLPFTVFLTAGAVRGFSPDDLSGAVGIGAGICLVQAVLSAAGFLPDSARKLFKWISCVFSACCLIVGFIFGASEYSSGLPESSEMLTIALSATVIYAQTVILTLREKDFRSVFSALSLCSFMWAAVQWTMFGGPSSEYVLPLACAVTFAYYLIIRFSPLKIRLFSESCDIIYLICGTVLSMMQIAFGGFYEAPLLMLLSSGAAAVMLSCSQKGKYSAAGKIGAALTALLLCIPISSCLEKWEGMSFPEEDLAAVCLWGIIVCAAAAVFAVVKRLRHLEVPLRAAVVVTAVTNIIVSLDYSDFTTPYFAVLTLYCVIWTAKNIILKTKTAPAFYSLMTSVLLLLYSVGTELSEGLYALVFPAWGILILTAAVLIADFFGFSKSLFAEYSERFLCAAAPLCSALMFWGVLFEDSLFYDGDITVMRVLGVMGVLLCCAGAYACAVRKFDPFMYLPLLMLYAAADEMFGDENCIYAAVVLAVYALAGRLIFRNKLFETGNIRYTDCFSLSAFIGAAILLGGSAWETFGGWCSVALLILNLVRKDNSPRLNKGLLTASAVAVMPLWWSIPFGTDPLGKLPRYMHPEFNMIPVLLSCILLRVIYRKNPEKINTVCYVTAICCSVILLISALGSEYAFDAVFLGVLFGVFLAASFFIRRKRWFFLGAGGLAAEGVLKTLTFWSSAAWWIYLLITGAILIIVGIRSEIRKQKNSSEKKYSGFLSDWKW